MEGCVHVYTGDGKGKTTCAVGLITRAYGHGLSILFCQFLKGADSGETLAFARCMPEIAIVKNTKATRFIWQMNDAEREEFTKDTQKQFAAVVSLLNTQSFDLVVLDELLGTIENKMISTEDVLHFLCNKPSGLEVVITGRKAPQAIMDAAHYVSEIKAVKHPYILGIPARRGIEY